MHDTQEDSMVTQTATGVRQGGATMTSSDAVATIGVKDLKNARTFYEGKLGLEPEDVREDDVVTYSSGASKIFVYKSAFAGSNQATAATWVVGDVDAIVSDLRKKGVAFEHYEMPGTTLEGDVHVAGAMRAAWFKDPDGNILALVSEA
jgi:catechol 2,3-dioxygenase-like lactoylglutathione lyase family enzyme